MIKTYLPHIIYYIIVEVEALIAQLFLKTINMWKKLMISLNGIMKSNDSGRRVKDGFKMGV